MVKRHKYVPKSEKQNRKQGTYKKSLLMKMNNINIKMQNNLDQKVKEY